MANVAQTTANATLRKLASTGKVDIAYGRICIVKPEALRAMLAGSREKYQYRLLSDSASLRGPAEISREHGAEKSSCRFWHDTVNDSVL